MLDNGSRNDILLESHKRSHILYLTGKSKNEKIGLVALKFFSANDDYAQKRNSHSWMKPRRCQLRAKLKGQLSVSIEQHS